MPPFRTIEISEPHFEHEGLRFVTVKSPALRRRGDITLFIPEQAVGAMNLPLVVLLHGVYGSHWAWALKGGAHRTTRSLIQAGEIRPMVLAMPSDGLWGDGSLYAAHPDADHESWVLEDVPAAAAAAAPCLGNTSPLFLAGLSMGGYGALRLGSKHPHRVAGISGHASVTHARQLSRFVEEPLDFLQPELPELDPLHWMIRNRNVLPPLRFDCGTEDDLLEENRALHRALEENLIPHDYAEFPGAHTWTYWQEHLRESLLFFEQVLQNATSDLPVSR